MFSIWEHRYSYGICFSAVYALQNSTPNISTPNILSIFFCPHPQGWNRAYSMYAIMVIYIYIDGQNSFQTVSWGTVEWNLWTCETSLNNPYDLLWFFFSKRKAICYSISRPVFFTHCAFNHKLDQIWLEYFSQNCVFIVLQIQRSFASYLGWICWGS